MEISDFSGCSYKTALKNSLPEYIYRKICFLGVDNAPTMIGKDKGLYGQLLFDLPYLLINGCINHKENLII